MPSARRSSKRGALALLATSTFAAVSVGGAGQAIADTTTITVSVPGCVVGGDDLLGWWKGEGDLRAVVGPDLAGSVGHGPGLIGEAFDFSGGDSISVSDIAEVGDGLTVDMWVKPESTQLVQTLMSRWDFSSGTSSSFALMLLPSGVLLLLVDDASTRQPDAVMAAAPQLLDGYFHHVAATWDASVVTLYVDGTAVSSQPSTGGSLQPASDIPLRLGSSGGPGTAFRYTGMMDEPAIARRALSATEVRAIVDAGPHAKCDAGGNTHHGSSLRP